LFNFSIAIGALFKSTSAGAFLGLDLIQNPDDFRRRMQRIGAAEQPHGSRLLSQGQEMQGGRCQRLASFLNLFDFAQFRSATPTEIGSVQLRMADRTLLHVSGLKIEEQIGQLTNHLGKARVVAIRLRFRDSFDQIDDFIAVFLDRRI
jgi:hypothetical protein